MHSGEDFKTERLARLEEILGSCFSDRSLLETAFTHKSWSNEKGGEDNERLEFLGDAVLELILTEELYRQNAADEGGLTKLRQQYVSQEALEEACKRADLMQYLRYVGREDNIGGKTASNLFEAALGALYLDGGLKAAKKLCDRYLKCTERDNWKSLLQEYVQERAKTIPKYETQEENGEFFSEAEALGMRARGRGKNKQSAETEAARALLEKLKEGKRH